jgi:glutathione S-transferase
MSAGGTYTLFGRPGSGSGVCEAMLAMCHLPHELVDMDPKIDAQAKERLRKINPLTEVPTLVLPNGGVMTESAAIAVFLADLCPERKLSPNAADPQRPKFLRWMSFLSANNYMTVLRIYYPQRYTNDPDGAAAVKAAALARNAFEWGVFASAIDEGPFILGETASAVDIYASMLISWDDDIESLFLKV